MSKQYYVREGRRFVKTDVPSVIDHRGEYYNTDGSFSKEKRNDSVGVCIIQNPTECIICGLCEYENVSPDTVLSLLRILPDWRLGEQEEMHDAVKFYGEKLNLIKSKHYRIHVYESFNGLFYFYTSIGSSEAKIDFSNKYSLHLFKTVKL